MKKLLTGLLFTVLYGTVMAQDIAPVTDKVFIQGVHIQSTPTAQPYFGNVLVVDGLISQIGPSITPPFDAKIISGDSLYAYAGFIAPASHIGLKSSKEEEQKKPPRPGYPTDERAGITPEHQAKDQYSAKDKSIENYRKLGYTIAHALPHGKMMPGMGAVISLNGKDYSHAVITEDQSAYAQWKGAGGVFPATLIGVMASWRELYKNAELSAQHQQRYQANPRNRMRPEPSPAITALIPVTQRKTPVFFKSEKSKAISRALILQHDLGFDLVLTEVKDADRFANKIKAANASVLVSLDLPEAMKEEKKKEKEDSEDSDKAPDPEMEHLKARKKKAIDRYVNQAKLLSEQGIPVAFSYLEVKPKDIHPNIRRMVKGGLSSADALAALTTRPAQQLGISNIAGTLESGKMAHMVLMTMPLDSADAKIKMVLVDGHVHEYETKEKKKKKEGESDEAPVDITGDWSYTIEIPGMTSTGSMKITQQGDDYEIELTSNQAPGETLEATNVVRSGNNLTFSFTVNAGGDSVTVDNDINFEADSLEGNVSVADFGSFEITGSKTTPE